MRRGFGFFTLLIFWSISASAIPEGGGFYTLDELPVKPRALEAAKRAVVRMNNCSAVILSNTGLVATNIHCIKECLSETWNNKPDIKQRRYEKPGFYSIVRYEDRIPKNLKCLPHVLSLFTIFDYQLQSPEFVWMGKGRLTHEEPNVTELLDSEFNEMKDATEDVVVFRYKLHKDFPKVPCMPLSRVLPVKGKLLWTIGFPGWNHRKNGKNSDGSTRYASMGRARASVMEDPVYQEYAAAMDAEKAAEFWRRETRIWDRDHLILSSSDAYGGNSGGLIMDSKGAVGITFTVTKESGSEYTGGTTIGVSTAHLRHRLAEDVGADVVREIDACKN
jgi:hypothetical protein